MFSWRLFGAADDVEVKKGLWTTLFGPDSRIRKLLRTITNLFSFSTVRKIEDATGEAKDMWAFLFGPSSPIRRLLRFITRTFGPAGRIGSLMNIATGGGVIKQATNSHISGSIPIFNDPSEPILEGQSGLIFTDSTLQITGDLSVSNSAYITNDLTVTDDIVNSGTLTGNQIMPMFGCTDSSACNYDSLANIDDGSCYFTLNYSVTTSIVNCFGGSDGSISITAIG